MAMTRWQPFGAIDRQDPFTWEPFQELERMQRQMDRLFGQMRLVGNGESSALAFMPSAEIEETADAIHLKLEVPGLEAKDLDVEVSDDRVSIRGERKSETKTAEKGMIRSEFYYGKFERIIPLTASVKHDKVKADYKNGILQLTLPKAEESKKKAVKINVA